ncbi:hypothetical protein QUF76_17600 [Desulfobacterales bacterium HSG16]|nr:hypothetical protein [Desulfobacterales bacterium HSG16]
MQEGEWFIAAKKAGAEKIFSVDNNPVVVMPLPGISGTLTVIIILESPHLECETPH